MLSRLAVLMLCVLWATSSAAQDAPAPKKVTFDTADGVTLHADVHVPAKPNGRWVILLPMYSQNRATYAPLAPALTKAGYAALALDLRGHGESVKQGDKTLDYGSFRKGGENLFLKMHADVAAAKAWLVKTHKADAKLMSLVGASVGCSVSLDVASRDKDFRALVLLSPGTSYLGLDSVTHAKACAGRRVLMVAAANERKAPDALAPLVGETAAVDIHPAGTGHGTRMFAPLGGKLQTRIVSWLDAQYKR